MGCVCRDGGLRDDDYRYGHGFTRGWNMELEIHLVRGLPKHTLRQVGLI